MSSETEIQMLQSRVAELEDRLQFVYRRLNIEYAAANADPVLSPKVQDALRIGNTIEAIKIYRELTDCSLAEAKAAIDRVS